MNFEEVIIVGSGPCGMSTALELKKHRINPLIIEKGNIVNSIYSYPTHQTFFSSSDKLEIGDMPFISAKHKPVRIEALAYYREVAKRNKLRINAFETVQDISKKDNLFTVKTINQFDEEVFYKTKYVILATGYYDQPNFLNIPGSSLPHVTHYFKEAHPYFNQKVVVIGGKNSAIDTALELYHANADVTLLYRGPDYSKSIKPWILPEFISLVKHNKVKVAFNANVIEIKSDIIRYEVDQEIIEEPIDFVFAMTGYHPQIELLKKLNVEVDLKSGRPEFNSDTYETNVTNLYVAGVIISGFESNETFIENGRLHGKKIASNIYLDKEKN